MQQRLCLTMDRFKQSLVVCEGADGARLEIPRNMRHGKSDRDFCYAIRPPRSIASFAFGYGYDCSRFRIADFAAARVGL
jgi:hypothetical protein